MKYKLKSIFTLIMLLALSLNINADQHEKQKRIFTEDEFISLFSGKPKSRVLKYLGKPDSKEIAIKPKGASSVIGRPTVDKRNPNKKSKIEMVKIKIEGIGPTEQLNSFGCSIKWKKDE